MFEKAVLKLVKLTSGVAEGVAAKPVPAAIQVRIFDMMVGERLQVGESILIDLAAKLANTSQQYFSCGAKGSILPTGVLFAWVALSPLQDPLQRIIDDPPALVELRYEPI